MKLFFVIVITLLTIIEKALSQGTRSIDEVVYLLNSNDIERKIKLISDSVLITKNDNTLNNLITFFQKPALISLDSIYSVNTLIFTNVRSRKNEEFICIFRLTKNEVNAYHWAIDRICNCEENIGSKNFIPPNSHETDFVVLENLLSQENAFQLFFKSDFYICDEIFKYKIYSKEILFNFNKRNFIYMIKDSYLIKITKNQRRNWEISDFLSLSNISDIHTLLCKRL